MKHFRGFYRDGMTFGMEIDATSSAYRAMKKYTERKRITGRYGREITALVCPYRYVAGVMREAGWIVAEHQSFTKCQIEEGICDGQEIYIEYPDGIHF